MWLGWPAAVADLIEVVAVTARRDSTIVAQFEVKAHLLDEPECFTPPWLCATVFDLLISTPLEYSPGHLL